MEKVLKLRCISSLGAGLVFLGAVQAHGQTLDRRGMLPIEGTITHPDWTRRPNGGDLETVYPAFALSLRASGRAQMQCDVRADGKVENCIVVEENPPGLGFGEAALKLSGKFEMKPEVLDGKAVGGAKVDIPIRFQMGTSPDAKAAMAAEPPLDDVQIALIKRLVVVQKAEAHQRELTDRYFASFAEQKRPQLAGAALAKFDADMAAAKTATYEQIPDFVEKYATVSVRGLSVDELKSLVAFYETPTGQKWSELSAGAAVQERYQVIRSDFARALAIRLCAVSSCADARPAS